MKVERKGAVFVEYELEAQRDAKKVLQKIAGLLNMRLSGPTSAIAECVC